MSDFHESWLQHNWIVTAQISGSKLPQVLCGGWWRHQNQIYFQKIKKCPRKLFRGTTPLKAHVVGLHLWEGFYSEEICGGYWRGFKFSLIGARSQEVLNILQNFISCPRIALAVAPSILFSQNSISAVKKYLSTTWKQLGKIVLLWLNFHGVNLTWLIKELKIAL